MLTQRDTDIALIEGKAEVQRLLEEWATDYLGSRLDGIDTGGGPERPDGQEAEGAEVAQEEEGFY